MIILSPFQHWLYYCGGVAVNSRRLTSVSVYIYCLCEIFRDAAWWRYHVKSTIGSLQGVNSSPTLLAGKPHHPHLSIYESQKTQIQAKHGFRDFEVAVDFCADGLGFSTFFESVDSVISSQWMLMMFDLQLTPTYFWSVICLHRVLGKLQLESTPINTKGYETLLRLV